MECKQKHFPLQPLHMLSPYIVHTSYSSDHIFIYFISCVGPGISELC